MLTMGTLSIELNGVRVEDKRCDACRPTKPTWLPRRNVWGCVSCTSVCCEHTAVGPTGYGNCSCQSCAKAREKRRSK